ncbi:MAG: transporter substrate-binding domain-containing protein [Candidatus Magnetomorum sp.]|nr:transporter substrate-binding domain-containing protein [Candidatus Magnetomorum sp.]
MKKGFLVLMICLFVSQVVFAEQTVTLATLEWEPYIGPNMKNNGYVHEIVEGALKRSNITVDIRFLPWARAVNTVQTGKRDGLFPEYYDEGRLADFVFSDSFPGGPVGLYKRKDNKVAYPVDPQKNQTAALEGLKQFKFGVVRDYVNTKEFDEAAFLKKEEVNSDETNLKKLFKGRIDFIFIDKYVAKHIIVTKYPHFLGDLEFMEPPLEVKPLYIAFSKKAPEYESKLKAFNSGLKQLEKEGMVAKIMEKHGF